MSLKFDVGTGLFVGGRQGTLVQRCLAVVGFSYGLDIGVTQLLLYGSDLCDYLALCDGTRPYMTSNPVAEFNNTPNDFLLYSTWPRVPGLVQLVGAVDCTQGTHDWTNRVTLSLASTYITTASTDSRHQIKSSHQAHIRCAPVQTHLRKGIF